MRHMWLANVARLARLAVIERKEWTYRGKDMAGIGWLVVHVTVTSDTTKDEAVHALIERGRPDLAGPLYHQGVQRGGEVAVYASGRCNHNGYGEHGNDDTLGVVLINDGDADPVLPVQYDALVRLLAADCVHLKLPASRIRGHKEEDPKRKIDPLSLRMDTVRAQVGLHMLTMQGWAASNVGIIPTSHRTVGRWEEQMLERIEMTMQVDEEGRGWSVLSGASGAPAVPFGTLVSVRPQGSAPQRDGYWPLPEVGEQDHGGDTLITVEGGPPKGVVTFWLWVVREDKA